MRTLYNDDVTNFDRLNDEAAYQFNLNHQEKTSNFTAGSVASPTSSSNRRSSSSRHTTTRTSGVHGSGSVSPKRRSESRRNRAHHTTRGVVSPTNHYIPPTTSPTAAYGYVESTPPYYTTNGSGTGTTNDSSGTGTTDDLTSSEDYSSSVIPYDTRDTTEYVNGQDLHEADYGYMEQQQQHHQREEDHDVQPHEQMMINYNGMTTTTTAATNNNPYSESTTLYNDEEVKQDYPHDIDNKNNNNNNEQMVYDTRRSIIPTDPEVEDNDDTILPTNNDYNEIDLRTDDVEFKAIATVYVDFLSSKAADRTSSYSITKEEVTILQAFFPLPIRLRFVSAVKQRSSVLPVGGGEGGDDDETTMTSAEVLASKCFHLGLGHDNKKNILFGKGSERSDGTIRVKMGRQARKEKRRNTVESTDMNWLDKSGLSKQQQELIVAAMQGGGGGDDDKSSSVRKKKSSKHRRSKSNSRVSSSSSTSKKMVLPPALPPALPPVFPTASPSASITSPSTVTTSPSTSASASTATTDFKWMTDTGLTPEQMLVTMKAMSPMEETDPPTAASKTEDTSGRNSSTSQLFEHVPESVRDVFSFRSASRRGGEESNLGIVENERRRWVTVTAPRNLHAGHTFKTQVDDAVFLATVPECGVRRGETFKCECQVLSERNHVPGLAWRDGLEDIFKHGPTHGHLILSFLSPLAAAGQVMTRLGYNYLGQPSSKFESQNVFYYTLTTVFMWIVLNLTSCMSFYIHWMRGGIFLRLDLTIFALVNLIFYGFAVFVIGNTRSNLRKQFKIPSSDWSKGGGEDYILTLLMMPLVVAQMGRHTADYSTFEYHFISRTGLWNGVKLSVESGSSAYTAPNNEIHNIV